MNRFLLASVALLLCTGCPSGAKSASAPSAATSSPAGKTEASDVAEIAAKDDEALKGKAKGLTPAALAAIKQKFEAITRGKRQGEASVADQTCTLVVTWPEPNSKGAMLTMTAQTSGEQILGVAIAEAEGRAVADEVGATQFSYEVRVVDGQGTVLAEGSKPKDATTLTWKGEDE